VGFIKWIDGNFTNLSVKMPDDIHADIKRYKVVRNTLL